MLYVKDKTYNDVEPTCLWFDVVHILLLSSSLGIAHLCLNQASYECVCFSRTAVELFI